MTMRLATRRVGCYYRSGAARPWRNPMTVRAVGGIALGLGMSGAIVPSASAQSQDDGYKRLYVGANVGWENRDKSEEREGTFTTWEDGYSWNLVAGVRVIQPLRLEFEYAFFKNDADTVSDTVNGVVEAPADGYARLHALMLNAYFDFTPSPKYPLKLYLGGGLGNFKTELRNLSNAQTRSVPPELGGPLIFTDDTPWSFAWQIKAGASYSVTPSFDVVLDYRFFHGDEVEFVFEDLGGLTLRPPESEVQTISLGVRYNFF